MNSKHPTPPTGRKQFTAKPAISKKCINYYQIVRPDKSANKEKYERRNKNL